MLGEHSDKIAKATKMTFAHLDEHQGRGALIGETEFAIPDKEDEKVKLYIYMATPKFDLEAMNSEFSQFNDEKTKDFVGDLCNYLMQFSRASLHQKVKAQQGSLNITLNGHNVTLQHKKHFFFDLKDKKPDAIIQ